MSRPRRCEREEQAALARSGATEHAGDGARSVAVVGELKSQIAERTHVEEAATNELHGCYFFSLRAAEFMQKRWWVGAGPSSKTCPRCPPHRWHTTSTRRMPWLPSELVPTLSSEMG